MDPNELVSVYKAANAIEANLVRNMLVESGVEAAVGDEIEAFAGLALDPPEVLVRLADQAKAATLVAQYDQQRAQQEAAPDWACPSCSASVPATFDECDQCGASRPGAA